MPRVKVTSPDGQVFYVTAPEGATDAEIQAYAEQNMPKMAAAEPQNAQQAAPEETPLWDRIKQGVGDPIVGAGQIADRLLINPIRQAVSPGATSMEDVVRERERGYVAPDGVDWGRMGGNVANPMSWAGGGATTIPRIAGMGAMQGMLTPTKADQTAGDFAIDKAKQAGLGAGAGAAFGKLLRPFTPTDDAATLMQYGVQPTVGQAKGGMVNQLEQKMMSVPFLGDAIGHARNRASREFQEAAVARATGQTGQRGAARTVDEANELASNLYNRVAPNLVPTRESVTNVQRALSDALSNPEMTDESRRILSGIVSNNFANFGRLSGREIKRLDSELGHIARRWASGGPQEKVLSSQIYSVLQGMRDGLEHGLAPAEQGVMRQANTIYRNLIPINKAASARADEVVTPRNLQRATARNNKTDVSRMRDPFLRSATRTLTGTVPDSGTAGRIATAGGLGALAATGFTPLALAGAGGIGLGALGSLRGPQAALLGNTRFQQAINPYATNLSGMMAAAARSEMIPEDEALMELKRRRK